MNAFHGALHRLIAGLLVCLYIVMPASLPVAAQAGPVPTITVVVRPTPLHLSVQGWHFAPSSGVELHAEYYPMTKGTVTLVTANTVGGFAVHLPVLPLRCGVETIDVSASYNPYVVASNLVTRKVDFSPC